MATRLARQAKGRPRVAALVGALFLLVAAVVPPLASSARRLEVIEALQFLLLGVAVPALLVLGAPWRSLGLSDDVASPDAEGVSAPEQPRLVDRIASSRRRHREPVRSLAYLLLYLGAVVLWRTPAGVDGLVRHPWLLAFEALTLVLTGVGLWAELIVSPPLVPRLTHPMRIAVSAIAMWTIWITAYLLGLSHTSVYVPYRHVAGQELSVWADQALTTGLLWLFALAAFFPVIFSNLIVWLRGDDEADEALYKIVRDRAL